MTGSDRFTLLTDIGGTNTRVALACNGTLDRGTIRRYANKGRAGLEEILAEYMVHESVGPLAGACIAAAGPVRDDVATMTNLSWVIKPGNVAAATGANTVAVLNDLQAQGHALGHLAQGAVRAILPGKPARPHAARLVVGVGTGFNAAPVHETPGGRVVPPSEAGHTTLPCITGSDFALKAYLEEKHAFASVEHVVSGRGLERLHAYLAGHEDAVVSGEKILLAMQKGDQTARDATALFIRMLGRVIGDLALTHLPFGGIYLIGGTSRAIVPYLGEFGFDAAMRSKGRFSEFLAAFPVHVIEDDYAALQGCATYLQSRLRAE